MEQVGSMQQWPDSVQMNTSGRLSELSIQINRMRFPDAGLLDDVVLTELS